MGKKIFRIVLHLLGWLVLLGTPVLFFYEDDPAIAFTMLKAPYFWLFSLSFGFLYYLINYILIPKLYLRNKLWQFVLSLFLLFAAFYLVKPFFQMINYYLNTKGGVKLHPATALSLDGITCILFVIVLTLAMAIQMIRQSRATEKRALLAETEKATAELSFLKAQINPHFLFNTLNNIYSLSIDNHPETSASIMKLSNLMRYITDDATKDFVPLEDEIASINDYIALQKLRHSAKVKLNFSVSGEIEERQIAPLILMTYIENVFKYGISSHEEAPITIRISAEENGVKFFCQNKIFATTKAKERTGIGLINTRQRLQYLYPKKHTLAITNENNLYTVALALQV